MMALLFAANKCETSVHEDLGMLHRKDEHSYMWVKSIKLV
jgi:hypothetical protein